MKIEIDSEVIKELEYMIELHKKYNADADYNAAADDEQTDVKLLVNYILKSVADGHRRPESRERGIVNSLGLTVECGETNEYRQSYGAK